MPSQPVDEQVNPANSIENASSFLDISQNALPAAPSPVNGINFSSKTDIANSNENQSPHQELQLFDFDLECGYDEFFQKCLADLQASSWDDLFDDALNSDESRLNQIDELITDRSMNVEIQPPTDIRRRYESDGKRQIEKSRSKPMTIKLPDLEKCQTDSTETIWLQLSLITTDQNPSAQELIHTYRLEYHDDDSITSEDGSVRVLLKLDDIQKKTKQLARISIIKKKLDEYNFQLIPYEPLLASNPNIENYENATTKSTVTKAKCFRDAYHLESSRIACQILIKKNDKWHLTNIICKTEIMHEKQPKNSSNKRSTSVHTDDIKEKIIKKLKLTCNSLPIARVQ